MAVKSAISEGISPGGGIAYIDAVLSVSQSLSDGKGSSSFNKGVGIITTACYAPFRQILTNASLKINEVYDELLKTNGDDVYGMGYDVKNFEVVNMKESGIIDPTKVSRVALESASSIAGILLTTECSVIN